MFVHIVESIECAKKIIDNLNGACDVLYTGPRRVALPQDDDEWHELIVLCGDPRYVKAGSPLKQQAAIQDVANDSMEVNVLVITTDFAECIHAFPRHVAYLEAAGPTEHIIVEFAEFNPGVLGSGLTVYSGPLIRNLEKYLAHELPARLANYGNTDRT